MNGKEKVGIKNFVAEKIERPGKTIEEIEAEVNAFNAQELAKIKQEND